MKIAILTSGLLPIPAIKGGAIETLLDSFIEQNEKMKRVKLDVYSIPTKHERKKYTKYQYINNGVWSFFIKIFNKILGTNIPTNFFYQKKMIKKVNKKNYDYIILENYPELSLKLKSDRIIEYVHSDIFNKDTKNAKKILNKLYRVITVSDFIKKRVDEIDNNNKTLTVLNCIDFDKFDEKEYQINRKKFRKKFYINKRDIVFIFSGRLSPEKGPLEAIKAFVNANLPHSKLIIVGGIWYGVNKSNCYYDQLKKYANENVIFAGYVPHAQIQDFLCIADVGIVPSLCNEAAGLSVVEFMARKNIVIASNRGGIPEYIENNNYLIEFNESQELIDKLTNIIKNIKIDENIKKRNLMYSQKFSVEYNYSSILDILEDKN